MMARKAEDARRSDHPAVKSIISAAQILPWWVNLILAEVTFVILFVLNSTSSGHLTYYGQFIIPAILLAASMIATAEADRKKQEIRRRQRKRLLENEAETPVTKFIVKDLLRGGYHEGWANVKRKESENSPVEEEPDTAKTVLIIGSVALSTIFSTIIVAKIGFQSPEKIVPIAATKPPYQPPAPQPQRNFSVPEVKQAPVQPQMQRPAPSMDWSQYSYVKPKKEIEREETENYNARKREGKIYAYEKNGIMHYVDSPDKIDLSDKPKNNFPPIEELIGYKVYLKNGATRECKQVLRMRQGMLSLIDEKIQIDTPDNEIRDIERRTRTANGIRIAVLTPDQF